MTWSDVGSWWGAVTEWFENPAVAARLKIFVLGIASFVVGGLLRRVVTKVESKVSENTTPIRALQRTQTLSRRAS